MPWLPTLTNTATWITDMNDREMLELAAKAAGSRLQWRDMCGGYERVFRVPLLGGKPWNPFTDDGDEARLEAVLGLNVLWGSRTVTVGRKHFGPFEERYQEHGGDKQAARRRAGVRAAAEIGRSVP